VGEVVVKRFEDYTVEKFRSLFRIMDEAIDDVAPAINEVNELTDKRLIPVDKSINLFKELEELSRGLHGFESTTKLSFVTLHKLRDGFCHVDIVEPHVGLFIEVPSTTDFCTASLHNYVDLDVNFVVMERVDLKWKYTCGNPIYLLFMLYKGTELGYNDKFIDILKKYGVYDVISYLSDLIDLKIKYPVTEAIEELVGSEFMDAEVRGLGYFVDVDLRFEVRGELRDIADEKRFAKREYEISKTFDDMRYLLMYFEVYGKPTEVGTTKIEVPHSYTPEEIISIVDEAIFGLVQLSAVILKLHEYLRGV